MKNCVASFSKIDLQMLANTVRYLPWRYGGYCFVLNVRVLPVMSVVILIPKGVALGSGASGGKQGRKAKPPEYDPHLSLP